MEEIEFEKLNEQVKQNVRIALQSLYVAKLKIEEVEVNLDKNQKEKMRLAKYLLNSSIRAVGTWPIKL